MNFTHTNLRSCSPWRSAQGWRPFAVLAVLAAGMFGEPSAFGRQPINVPNYSFESPSTGFAIDALTSWQELPQPAGYTPIPVPQNIHLANLGLNSQGVPIHALVMDTVFLTVQEFATFGVTTKTNHQQLWVNVLYSDGHVTMPPTATRHSR